MTQSEMEAPPHSAVAFYHTPSLTPPRQKVQAQAVDPVRAVGQVLPEHKSYNNLVLCPSNNAGLHAYRICYTLLFPSAYGYISGIASSEDSKQASYSLYCTRQEGNKPQSCRSLPSLAEEEAPPHDQIVEDPGSKTVQIHEDECDNTHK